MDYKKLHKKKVYYHVIKQGATKDSIDVVVKEKEGRVIFETTISLDDDHAAVIGKIVRGFLGEIDTLQDEIQNIKRELLRLKLK